MKHSKFLFFLILFGLVLAGCEDYDDSALREEMERLKKEQQEEIDKLKEEQNKQGPYLNLKLPEGFEQPVVLAPGEKITVDFDYADLTNLSVNENPIGYDVTIDEEKKQLTVEAQLTATNTSFYLTGIEPNGKLYVTPRIFLDVNFMDDLAILVLNEGAAWAKPVEMGSLVYISPAQKGFEQVYATINGRPLGNVCQDLFIKDGKIYVVSQTKNPSGDGLVTIFDAKTMRKIANFSDEFPDKSHWPTHIGVFDDQNVILRDDRGLWRLNTVTRQVNYLEGTRGARKNTMPVVANRLFVTKNRNLWVFEANNDVPIDTIKFDQNISGVVPVDKDHIYVSTSKGTEGKIYKINATSLKIDKVNEIADADRLLVASFAAAPSITAKGDTIYYSGLSTKVYRHIFSKNETKLMIDVGPLWPEGVTTYNTCAVHPITGRVYINRIAGWSPKHKINKMMELDLSGDEGKLVRSYDNLTRYPAGIFFPASFK